LAIIEPVKTSASLGDKVRSLRLPSQPEPSLWERKSVWAVLISIAAIGGVVAWRMTQSSADAPPATTSVADRSSPAASERTDFAGDSSSTAGALSTPAPIAATGDVTLQSTGYIIPAHQILVSPKVSGMIVALNFEEGMRVEKGFVLAELESVDYKADVAHAQAMLESSRHKLLELTRGYRPEEIAAAEAELAETQAQRDQLYSEWKRNVGLRANKTVTEREYEQSESAYKAMDRRAVRLSNNFKLMQDGPRVERIDVAKAEVQQAEADLAKAQWRLSNCTITAPISGTILKKNAEVGNVVNPVAFNGSFSLCDMADLSDLEVDLSIQERNDLSRVYKGQKCKIRAEAFPDRVYDGVVSRLMPIADRAKGAVPVRVKVTVPAEEEGAFLKPEMSAVVSFLK
jgi:multidrug resistance efflux pump